MLMLLQFSPFLFTIDNEKTRIWKATNDGSYSVKSAYCICIHESLPVQNSSHWQLPWHLHVPPRVRSFLWRATHQRLPTRNNLSKRNAPCSETCISCDLLAESHTHLFFICHKFVACWNLIDVDGIIRDLLPSVDNFQKLLFDFFNRLTDQQRHLAAMTLWSLWKSRNMLL